jgi:YegS/Rv2252/BmrU family lipid kinase
MEPGARPTRLGLFLDGAKTWDTGWAAPTIERSSWEGQAVKKAFVILNPAAGRNAHEFVREALRRHFTASHIQYEVHETMEAEKPGEIVRARMREGFDLAVAAGGDGTVSEVIDGLVEHSKPLGIIPTGTGNLIARELGIPDDVDESVAVIAGAPRSMKIDAMRIGRRAFVLNASVGISASVIGSTTRESKNRLGRIAYLVTTVLKMFALKPRYLVVAVDGMAHEYRAVEVAIMNCGMLAKQLYPKGPEIRIDDGHLDVWILGLKTIRDYPRYIRGLMQGRSVDLLARFIKADRSVTIRSNVPLPVQADGDMIGTTPVEVDFLLGAITVLVPEEPLTVPEDGLDRDILLARYQSDLARVGRRE